MTEIDLNEKKPEEDPAKTEAKVEEEKLETAKTEPEPEAPKEASEADESEAKVAADEAEKEKKVKKSNKTKDRILSSFRWVSIDSAGEVNSSVSCSHGQDFESHRNAVFAHC